MARKLKTYQTSLGFFDQAIAAPSMKAALEAWGADSNLFHQGAAKESHDPDVIAATVATPASFSGARSEPTDLSANTPSCPPILAAADQGKPAASRKAQRPSSVLLAPSTRLRSGRPLSPMSESKGRLELERAKEEATRQKERERRQQAVDEAQAALDKAEQGHAKRAAAIEAEVEALEKRSQIEEARWDKEKERLEATLRRARS
jgi:hypothetical protein